jgi:cytidine deaminase
MDQNYSKYLTDEEVQNLLVRAQKARFMAYCPYSKYKVGAVVYAIDPVQGFPDIFMGCNVENASYGLTICAERTAIFRAVSEGHTDIKVMAIATDNGGMSCGACRQVEYEFNPDMEIYSISALTGEVKSFILSEIHKEGFGPEDL